VIELKKILPEQLPHKRRLLRQAEELEDSRA
jgi:hypothetical protein